ncbi:hypothetical protein B0T25DRAFT_467549 [Lasiosphaeria hispida]|uniref:Uncharacterized protein n=1 Tax=Lasiosphaeria hispida TaxID=260671 RepID=A0AAJ0HT06_9PEZI|nr:hypothetical protein B0T25DRAFT_467549 [Lasiosphaeria hispida]
MAFNPYPSPDSSGDDRRKRARLRRSEATSSDSSDAGEFTIFNVRHRVAAPSPHPLPMKGRWDEQCASIHQELGAMTLKNEARRILSDEKVSDILSIELTSRIPYIGTDLPTKGQPTILIVARWLDESCSTTWERAVSKIKKFIDSKRVTNRNLRHLDIAVEMIAEEHVLDKYISPVTAELVSRGMETDWACIKDRVGKIMESYPDIAGHVTSIQLFKLGFSPYHEKNPNTVYISVDYACLETKWPPVVGEIQQYLNQFKYADLNLHFEHNIVEHCAFPLVPSRRSQAEIEEKLKRYRLLPELPYKNKVNLGDDICASNYLKGSDGNDFLPLIGTLGCWLEIKTDNYPNGVKVALTNYHVVRPVYEGFQLRVNAKGEARIDVPKKGSRLWKADENGIGRETGAPTIEHPTRLKHNFGVVRRETMVKSFTGDLQAQAQKELDKMAAFFDNGEHLLGTVFCASGYRRRTANNGRLDWALVLPLDEARIGENKLPPFKMWGDKYNFFSGDDLPSQVTFGGSLKQPTAAGLRGLSQQEPVFKVGATTVATMGKFSTMKSDVNIAEDRHLVAGLSEEFSYVQGGNLVEGPGDASFATKGDSGSVVWDKEGRAVGLLFTGQVPQGAEKETLVYVTPIHNVFEDIKRFSGGGIKEIRIVEAASTCLAE